MVENITDKFSLYSKYNVLLQTINDGLILVSDRRIRYSNKTFADMFEYSIDELTDLFVDDLIAPSFKDMVIDMKRDYAVKFFLPNMKLRQLQKTEKLSRFC